MNIAVILAGGSGIRLGNKTAKQFVEIFDKPVIAYTAEVFQKHNEIDAIEIVCNPDYINVLENIVQKYKLNKVKWITNGGADFQHSVMNGIFNLENYVNDDDIVLVHYAVSPFVNEEIISDAIKVTKEKGNAASATPCFLLMGTNDADKSLKWVDRDKLMQLNSPQSFKYKYVKDLYLRAQKEDILSKVEPHTTSLMFYMGETVYFSKGNQTNIKITTKEDLELLKAYALLKKYNESSAQDKVKIH